MRSLARPAPTPAQLSRDEARAFLVGHHGLNAITHPLGAAGARSLLKQLRCIQLDPLDPWGTNADLVALARIDGLGRGDIYTHIYPGHAFEHYAKERCLLPADAFPYYRERDTGSHWWSHSERLKRLPKGVIDEVLTEIEERGPITSDELTDHGSVKPINWSGWKGTQRAALMAIEVLWTRCQIVVCGRTEKGKLYDVPSRALPDAAAKPRGDFARWALLERVEAAGLMSRNAGPMWSQLSDARTSTLPDELLEEGLLESVLVEGAAKPYLAPADFRSRRYAACDDRMRLLGPLDPMIWDRKLVQNVFGFEYIWEVYKPAEQRRWGWYVCPLLHRGQLVGRIEGAVDGKVLKVRKIWREREVALDNDALDAALARHAEACGVVKVARPRRAIFSPRGS